MMPRTYSVLVIREDLGGVSPAGWGTEPTRHAATAPIQLRAYENDLLHALSATGGLPGTDAKNEVVILHGAASTPELRDEARSALEDPLTRQQFFDRYRNITRIPLRIGPKDPAVSISTQDIILQRGDVVFVESREAETFYTGGLLPGGQFAIPRDYDLDVLGAVSIAGGSLSPAAGGNNYGRSMGYGGSLGSLLPPTRVIVIRKGHDTMQVIKLDLRTALTDPQQRILIQPNDLIMLEYTEFEMTMNAILSTVSFNLDLQTLFNH
jgi:protein involved in polysaccharide export with SLBB domain